MARERAKKANLHNRKLRDCRIHFSDVKNERKEESCIFITEGDSASGSITKSRDVNTQAVFSLRGKPLNSFGLTKKVVYENEEFNLLQAALDIEDGLDTLRYNKVIVATDADVDGMHIRLLIITFFLQFFPELIKKGHVYVLQTPLFRVRNRRTKIKNKKVIAEADAKSDKKGDFITRYCYSDEERQTAITELGPDPEITRFKGLGEISPDEFAGFIGPDIRLEQVTLHKTDQVQKLLEYYMGKNTMERQNFIIDNLVVEEDRPEEDIYEPLRKLQFAEVAISNLYVDKVDEERLVENAIRGMLDKLDPHSSYLTPKEVEQSNEPLNGNFEGIGVQFNMIEDTLLVIQPVTNGPSEKVGIIAGDRIVSVNDTARKS